MRLKKLVIFLSILLISGCSRKEYEPLETVRTVDLKRYVGKWYEIAAFPQSFQKDCNCTTAEYFLTDEDFIRVVNRCRKGSVKGNLDEANGKAFIVTGSNNAKLKVQFFWPFKGDYWIIELADDYSYAVVGHPSRDYLWILSRTPMMDTELYNSLIERISKKGFNINRLQKTNQDCW